MDLLFHSEACITQLLRMYVVCMSGVCVGVCVWYVVYGVCMVCGVWCVRGGGVRYVFVCVLLCVVDAKGRACGRYMVWWGLLGQEEGEM